MNDNDLSEHLKKLLRAPGLSAFEAPVRELVAAAWKPYAPGQTVTRLGSLHALQPGTRHAPPPEDPAGGPYGHGRADGHPGDGGFCRITRDRRAGPAHPARPGGYHSRPGGRAGYGGACLRAALLPPDRKAEIRRLRGFMARYRPARGGSRAPDPHRRPGRLRPASHGFGRRANRRTVARRPRRGGRAHRVPGGACRPPPPLGT